MSDVPVATDPNACLDEIRAALWAYNNGEPLHVVAPELVGWVTALDAWLSGGGSLPDEWASAAK